MTKHEIEFVKKLIRESEERRDEADKALSLPFDGTKAAIERYTNYLTYSSMVITMKTLLKYLAADEEDGSETTGG